MMFGFECTKCGLCCTNFNDARIVILFPSDLDRISKYLNLDEEHFIEAYCEKKTLNVEGNEVSLITLSNTNGNCVFLTEDNRCAIHEVKPYQCKNTPFNFLWNSQEIEFECLKNIKVPKSWNSKELDDEIFSTLFKSDLPSK
jgi:Fe-S-cluster containining protein